MPYRWKPREPVPGGARRIVEEQIDRAVDELDDPEIGVAATVHQVRKRCKKVRAVLRVLRGPLDETHVYADENAWYRDTARELSALRDAEALRETYDDLMGRYENELDRAAFGPFRGAMTRRRQELEADLDMPARLARCRRRLREARSRVAMWTARIPDGFEAWEHGLVKTCDRARKGQRHAMEDPRPERYHEWRKRAKYHLHHCRLLRRLWPASMQARIDEADRLADRLGDAHDISVLLRTLDEESDRFPDDARRRVLVGIARQRRHVLRAEAHPIGLRLFAEKGERTAARWATWWEAAEAA